MHAVLHKLTQQQEEAQKLGQSLKDILQTPKLRGNYGEAVLEEMLRTALPDSMWERQFTIEGAGRVDAVIKFKDAVIPIDSKFPREAYLRYLEAPDMPAKKAQWKTHEEAVKIHVKTVAKYIRPEKGTVNYALMFIPSEGVYYETVAGKNALGDATNLFEVCQENKIVPVSPNTLYPFLQVLLLSMQNLEIIQSAKKLQEKLKKLETNVEYFFKQYETIGDAVDKASSAYHTGHGHVERYKKQLDATLKLEEFPEDEGAGGIMKSDE